MCHIYIYTKTHANVVAWLDISTLTTIFSQYTQNKYKPGDIVGHKRRSQRLSTTFVTP